MEGLIGTLITSLATVLISAFLGAYNGALQAEDKAKLHLDAFQRFVVALPSWVIAVVVILFALSVVYSVLLVQLRGREGGTSAAPAPIELVESLQRQLAEAPSRGDLAKLVRERDALRDEIEMFAPLARLYRRTLELEEKLDTFRRELEDQEEKIDPAGPIEEWMRNTPVNQARFNADFRPQLVGLAHDLKQQYGWVFGALTDDKLTHEVYGSGGLTGFIEGVSEVKQRIAGALLATLVKFNV